MDQTSAIEAAKQTKTCPACAEKISVDAKRCPHCRKNVEELTLGMALWGTIGALTIAGVVVLMIFRFGDCLF